MHSKLYGLKKALPAVSYQKQLERPLPPCHRPPLTSLRVGRPPGTRNQLLLPGARREELAQMLQLGLSKTKAAAALGVHRNTLNAYLEQKPLK